MRTGRLGAIHRRGSEEAVGPLLGESPRAGESGFGVKRQPTILNSELVGRTGHYLNRLAEPSGKVLELLRACQSPHMP
jgi:hypothetical protein